MTDPKEIPNLIKLIDDESPEVQDNIIKELTSFGPLLNNELNKLSFKPNFRQQKIIDEILAGQKRIWLRKNWSNLFNKLNQNINLKSEYEVLESAVGILSEFLIKIMKTEHPLLILSYFFGRYQ